MFSPIKVNIPSPRMSLIRSTPTARPAARRTEPDPDDEFIILNKMAAEALARGQVADEQPASRGRCPECRTILVLPARAAGRRGRCSCGAVLNLHGPRRSDRRERQPVHPRVGKAAVFGLPFTPTDPQTGSAGPRMVYAPGCFDSSLRAVARGSEVVELWVMHRRGSAIADTRHGLDVWADSETLWAALTDRQTIAAADRLPHLKGLSVGITPVQSTRRPDGVVVVTEAVLNEVSLVDVPACPVAYFDPILALNRQPASALPAH